MARRPMVWANVNSPVQLREVQEEWLTVVHDLVATYQRLFELQDRKWRQPTGLCSACGEGDTFLHRLTACDSVLLVWQWQLRPDSSAPSEARQAAVVFLLGRCVAYLLGANAPMLHGTLSELCVEKNKMLSKAGRWPAALNEG